MKSSVCPRYEVAAHRWLVVVEGVIVVAIVAISAGANGEPGLREAPPLPRRVLQSPGVTLASLRGRPVIVHFWASACAPCIGEAPQIAVLAQRLQGRATLIGIDSTDHTPAARAFLRHFRWRFPVLTDRDGEVANRYRIRRLPTTVILDSSGRMLARLHGPQTEASLNRALVVRHRRHR